MPVVEALNDKRVQRYLATGQTPLQASNSRAKYDRKR